MYKKNQKRLLSLLESLEEEMEEWPRSALREEEHMEEGPAMKIKLETLDKLIRNEIRNLLEKNKPVKLKSLYEDLYTEQDSESGDEESEVGGDEESEVAETGESLDEQAPMPAPMPPAPGMPAPMAPPAAPGMMPMDPMAMGGAMPGMMPGMPPAAAPMPGMPAPGMMPPAPMPGMPAPMPGAAPVMENIFMRGQLFESRRLQKLAGLLKENDEKKNGEALVRARIEKMNARAKEGLGEDDFVLLLSADALIDSGIDTPEKLDQYFDDEAAREEYKESLSGYGDDYWDMAQDMTEEKPDDASETEEELASAEEEELERMPKTMGMRRGASLEETIRNMVRDVIKEKEEKKWMQKAGEEMEKKGTKGALHRQLGKKSDEKISKSELNTLKKQLQKKAEGDKKLSAADRKLLQRVIFALNAMKAKD